MKVVVGSDHRGVKLKSVITEYLESKGHEVVDVGTYTEDPCDYPIYSEKAGNMVASGEVDTGVVICSTGIGVSIALNKINDIRAALCNSETAAKYTRLHNDANMLVLPGSFVDDTTAKRITGMFLKTDFEGGRHVRRLELIKEIEKRNK